MTIADTARRALTRATILAADIDPALRSLDESASGFPSQVPMAGPATTNDTPTYTGWCDEFIAQHVRCDRVRPCPTHDLPGQQGRLNPIEAGSQRADRARTDLEQMTKAINEADRQLRIAADIAHRNATVRLDGTTVAERIAAVDKIWCTNCAQHGFRNPRREDGTVCDYCHSFKVAYPQYKMYPPKAVLEIWTTRGKVWAADVHRIMREMKAGAKQAKRKADPDWRTKPDPARKLEAAPLTAEQRRQKRLTA